MRAERNLDNMKQLQFYDECRYITVYPRKSRMLPFKSLPLRLQHLRTSHSPRSSNSPFSTTILIPVWARLVQAAVYSRLVGFITIIHVKKYGTNPLIRLTSGNSLVSNIPRIKSANYRYSFLLSFCISFHVACAPCRKRLIHYIKLKQITLGQDKVW